LTVTKPFYGTQGQPSQPFQLRSASVATSAGGKQPLKRHQSVLHRVGASLHCRCGRHEKKERPPMNCFIKALLQDEERSKTVLAAMTAIAGLLAIAQAAALNMGFLST